MRLEEVLSAYKGLPPDLQEQVKRDALAATKAQRWVPNPGPQQQAYYCEADELFYGGSAGGGKSDLLIGLSLTSHQRSLILRRTNKEASKLFERYRDVLGTRDGWNGQESVWRLPDGKVIDIGGCQLEDDKQKYKGTPHDLIGFDEVSDFTESQYTFITIWNRSTEPSQRCRVVAAGNPPTRPEGLWVIQYWAPWLDKTHPNPAQPGELRWFLGGKEVDGPGPHLVEGKMVRARSRTFLPARLEDNYDLAHSGYDAVLAGLPEELRLAYREGRFDASMKDNPWQVIPTEWIQQAQERWTDKPPSNVPMCAIGVDVAQGGGDKTVLAIRHDGWYAKPIALEGKLTPDGPSVAGLIIQYRRGDAKVVVDCGGGHGGSAYDHLKQNIGAQSVMAYKGATPSNQRSKDKLLKLSNVRTAALWKFREALDPSQPAGSTICLPHDPELTADLTAPTFEVRANGIVAESKEDVCARLGRSTDKGDAVIMAWVSGLKIANIPGGWSTEHGGRRRSIGVDLGPRHRR